MFGQKKKIEEEEYKKADVSKILADIKEEEVKQPLKPLPTIKKEVASNTEQQEPDISFQELIHIIEGNLSMSRALINKTIEHLQYLRTYEKEEE